MDNWDIIWYPEDGHGVGRLGVAIIVSLSAAAAHTAVPLCSGKHNVLSLTDYTFNEHLKT